MTKKDVSRRGFLKGIVHAAGLAMFAKISPFVPEVTALVNTKGNGNRLPSNATVRVIEGDEANQLVEQALVFEESLQLQAELSDFTPQLDSADVITFFATWRDEKTREIHRGPIASIPLANGTDDNKAYLYYCKINGIAQSAMAVAEIKEGDISNIDVLQVKEGQINRNQVISSGQVVYGNNNSPLMDQCGTVGSTVECMTNCLRDVFGCATGWQVVTCIVAMFSCVLAWPACLVLLACTVYCGAAFQICWTDYCCYDLQ